MTSKTSESPQNLSASREESFIRDLASQVGVKLPNIRVSDSFTVPVTAAMLYKLYNRFMEYLVRRSHSAAASHCDQTDGCELTPEDVCAAIQSNENLLFLADIFVDPDDEHKDPKLS